MDPLARDELDSACSMVDVLRMRAELQPGHVVLEFLADGSPEVEARTIGGLDERARAIGAGLRERVAPAEPVLVVHEPGLGFHDAFYGALYAGAVPVPAYPPDPFRLERSSAVLGAIAADVGARVALTSEAIRAAAAPVIEAAPGLGELDWLTLAEVEGDASAWRRPALDAETLCFLQYTSGSTSAPKGVMVTHGNLVAQSRLLRDDLDADHTSVGASWCPLYHDMGLVSSVSGPVYIGMRAAVLSPLDFLRRPAFWLETITRYGATHCGGPNFAFDLCARRVTFEERERLDLAGWRVAFNAAEPVLAETLDRFTRAFAPVGFRREAFQPCFGLAESVCMIASSARPDRPVVRRVDPEQLVRGRAVPAPEGSAGKPVVACGRPSPRHELVVVDPATGAPVPDGSIGEAWFRGPTVAAGYWRDEEATAATFGARTAAGEGPFLRTGDLGFVDGGELYPTGRIKDLIIVRGRNLYPQDVELTAQRAAGGLRPGCGAAFAVEGDDGAETVVLMQEVRDPAGADRRELAAAAREAVLREHGVDVEVVLVEPRTIPKTSSGKLQRLAARERYLAERPSAASPPRSAPARRPAPAPTRARTP
ncbi:MAG TPA: fatty acyl-AMP ligase [Thermoleophilaceae bacterium]